MKPRDRSETTPTPLDRARDDTRPDRTASLGLLLATALWGCSFTWAKAGGTEVNVAAGVEAQSALGPILFLGWRFVLASVVWVVVWPGARRGWTRRSMRNGALLGVLFWVPFVAQVLGLDRTSEAVSGFLTSLTVAFVPLFMTFVVRRPPPGTMWIAVAIATVGIWLMTGATPSGFGVGELLGLLCAVLFSVHLIVLNMVMPKESFGRMTMAQYVVVAVGCLLVVAIFYPQVGVFAPTTVMRILGHGSETIGTGLSFLGSRAVWVNLVLVTSISTLAAFGLVFAFQPRLTPTRAALIYLAEPIFAAGFAYLTIGRSLTVTALVGAGLILAANAVAELTAKRRRARSVSPVS